MSDLTRSATRLTGRAVGKRKWKYIRAGGLWDIEDPFVRQFVSGSPDGPISLHRSKVSFKDDLLA